MYDDTGRAAYVHENSLNKGAYYLELYNQWVLMGCEYYRCVPLDECHYKNVYWDGPISCHHLLCATQFFFPRWGGDAFRVLPDYGGHNLSAIIISLRLQCRPL